MIGRKFSQYQVVAKLGEGGMGEVYVAEDRNLKRRVALKVLPPGMAEHPDRLRRFQREAEAVAALNHPNIVTIHTIEDIDNKKFLIMELVEGRSLDRELPPDGLPLPAILDIAAQITDALAAAHDKGIVHRDLKPANIMVGPDGRVKVLDFGLAKFTDPGPAPVGDIDRTATAAPKIDLTREGAIVGTAPYMSPEQLQGLTIDQRTDIFALGIVLYEMATGRRPFQGKTAVELAAGIMRDTPPSLGDLRGDIPPGLEDIIETCLAKDPKERYQSAADIRSDLEALRSGTGSGNARRPVTQRRHRTRFGVVAAAVVLAALGVWWLRGDRTPPQPVAEGEPAGQEKIAVLPFAILGAEGDTRAFADGVHDDLLTTLAGIAELKVISRTSVMRYRDTTLGMPRIGRELGASHLLEGSIQQSGGKVRINVQLIEAATDEHLWAEKYDRELTVANLFDIQSEIAQTIAGALSVTMSTRERERIRRSPTDDLEAFYAYNRGRQLFIRSTFESLRAAVPEFERALEIDPDYLLANIALAQTHAMLATTGAVTRDEMLQEGRPWIDRAIALDPDNPYALAVLAGYQRAAGESDAQATFDRALALGPNIVEVLDIYAGHLRSRGRYAEAIPVIENALDLDPLSTSLHHDLGRSLIALGRFDEAMDAFRRISQIDPDNPYAAHGSGLASILGGRLREAAYWSDKTSLYDPADYENPATSAIIYISLGEFETAAARVDEALSTGPDEPYPLSVAALLETVRGDRARAVRIARAALAARLDDRWQSEFVFLRVIRDEGLVSGAYEESLAWYRQLTPELFGDPPEVTVANVRKAVDLAHLLQVTGTAERAEAILSRAIEVYDGRYTKGAANYPLGVAKAEALALLGRTDEALESLERCVGDGWRILPRWNTVLNPNFASVGRSPRFTALLGKIEADLDAQIAAFEEPER
jgi:serine/threonine-protein kinase